MRMKRATKREKKKKQIAQNWSAWPLYGIWQQNKTGQYTATWYKWYRECGRMSVRALIHSHPVWSKKKTFQINKNRNELFHNFSRLKANGIFCTSFWAFNFCVGYFLFANIFFFFRFCFFFTFVHTYIVQSLGNFRFLLRFDLYLGDLIFFFCRFFRCKATVPHYPSASQCAFKFERIHFALRACSTFFDVDPVSHTTGQWPSYFFN